MSAPRRGLMRALAAGSLLAVQAAVGAEPQPRAPAAPAPAAPAPAAPSGAAKTGSPAPAAGTPSASSAAGAKTPAAGANASAASAGVPGSTATGATPVPATKAPAASSAAARKKAQRVPLPTKEQLKAFSLLEEEAKGFVRDAHEFDDALTMIVRHHYEQRRRRVLSAVDGEITMQRRELSNARGEAIRRLEEFIAYYTGPNADAEATPDAMFRLASLYEERARTEDDVEMSKALLPVTAIYRRIIYEFPKYAELGAVHYYLGHALLDAGRLEEAQQAWRALVCHNRYGVFTDAKDIQRLALQPLVQDRPDAYWSAWYNRHPVPLVHNPKKPIDDSPDEELQFRDPYQGCEPIAQETEANEEPRYLAEIWWQLGNYHFDQLDESAGPYYLNRAVSAYDQSLKFKKPPLYGVALYKQAWAYFKQQRYHAAVDSFVNLLRYADEQEAKTGDSGADFRNEAYTYIAGSLTYVDIDGPPQTDPLIPRSDVLDVESDPLAAEQKMGVAITRVQDPSLIPQDKKWTVEIYRALGQEFIELTQYRNAIAMLDLALKKFPLDGGAPQTQDKVAQLYDELKRSAQGDAAREEFGAKALEARTKLAIYVGNTAWTQANRDDPEALTRAEELVQNGLQRAAADHTNFARAYYQRALELNDADEQRGLLKKAVAEYRLAESGWGAYLEQDPTAMDAYDSEFWLTDARFWVVVLQLAMEHSPSADEIQNAQRSALAVLNSNEDDKYVQQAGYYLVTLSEKVVEDQYRQFEESSGARGFARRNEVKFNGEGLGKKVVREPLPPEVNDSVKAREYYVARVPADRDEGNNALLYTFQIADTYFVYGQFEQARKYFGQLYERYCGVNDWGYKAWEKLISMSNFEGNAALSRSLAEGKSCAFDDATKLAEEKIRKPVRQGVAYLDARKLYEQAEGMKEGPERVKTWRAAALAYKVALDAAPDRDEAPEAAMNGAYAYKQVGEYDAAIAMYELFISRYGDSKTLTDLKSAANKKYQERVKYLHGAYGALAGAYVLFFDYPKAAGTFETISKNQNFNENDRREASSQALNLYASLGDTQGMGRAESRLKNLGGSPDEIAQAEFVVASADLKAWDAKGADGGPNRQARLRAQQNLEAYYAANRGKGPAAKYVVEAAYHLARMKWVTRQAGAAQLWQNVIAAYQAWVRSEPDAKKQLGSAQAGMAAEAEYTLLDDEIKKAFDYDTGHHHYAGTTVEVIAQYQKDALEAKQWYDKLSRVIDTYVSPQWTVAAISRQGSLYDSLRTGLYNTRPPELKLMDAKLEATLKRAEASGDADLLDKVDAVRVKVQQAWRDRRDQELDGADRVAVDRYANAVTLGVRYNISNASVTHAVRRLAFLTDVVGEAKIKDFSARVANLNYTPGMFQRMRPGLVVSPEPNALPAPAP